MKAVDIACVILASGLSERFGLIDKLSADLFGKPILSHVLDRANSVGFGQVFCVAKEKGSDEINWVENKNPEQGQGHALRLGLQSAQEKGWQSCAVMLGDMPLVSSAHLQKMIDKFDVNQNLISVCESIRMPPAIFNQAGMDLIISQNSAVTARAIFDELNPQMIDLDAESAQDVDTPEDLFRVSQAMKTRNRD